MPFLTMAALCVAWFSIATAARAADPGIVSVESKYSVSETIARFEHAIDLRSDTGWRIFAKIDHAAIGAEYGSKMLPRTSFVFFRVPAWIMYLNEGPTLALDVGFRVLIWQDDRDTVWFTFNSVRYWSQHVLGRHDVNILPGGTEYLTQFFESVADEVTK